MVSGDPKMSVTLINTQSLPSYSSERFYMLSELEQHAHSTTFLCDANDCDQTQDTAESSEASIDHGVMHHHHQQSLPSNYNILYILWRPDQTSSPRAFAEGTLSAAIQQWKTMDGSSTSTTSQEDDTFQTKSKRIPSFHLYLVVDIAASPTTDGTATQTTEDYDQDARQRQFQVKVDTAERLARHVAQSKHFRSLVDGITVGISNHVRAAPGLEACLDAVWHGSSHRRRNCRGAGDAKSNIGLVALHPDDLLGLQDETVTDAAQGVLQSRTCAEWNGNGNLLSFARRAQTAWCIAHGVDEESASSPDQKSRKRRGRRRGGGASEGDLDFDPLMMCLVVFFFGYVLSHLWVNYYAER